MNLQFLAGVGAIGGLTMCLAVCPAWGQETPTADRPARTTETALPGPPAGPPVTAYPLELLGLLAPPAQRGSYILTPSIAVSEEFNDNVFQENQNRRSDFITSFSPALTFVVNRPSYNLSAGYSFSADIYAKESRLNNAFDRQNFLASGLFRSLPTLTLTFVDTFALDRSTSVVAVQGTSTGRQESWSNTLTPGLTWQITPQDSLSLSASYGVLRFLGSSQGSSQGSRQSSSQGTGVGQGDSDTYGLQSNLGHAFTPRLTGTIGYNFTYLDLTGGQQNSTTHNPVVGLIYGFTPTLTGAVSGGPSFVETGGETSIVPGGSASLVQTLQFGSASVQYTRGVTVAGGFGGTNETQRASATLAVTTLYQGLVVLFTPGYTESTSVRRQQNESVDVKVIELSLGAAYVIAQYTTLFAGYTFVHQRTGSTSIRQVDVDQNRVRFGLQFGYPFNFD
jgi:hypothetical protein